MDTKTFAQQFLLLELEKMKAADVRLHLLASIVHSIETCGALLDQLPFKAKGQGKKRFGLTLRKLFPLTYLQANQQVNLYAQLRSHLSHSMLPAKNVRVHLNAPDKHLKFDQEILNICLDSLYADHCNAVKLLIEKLDSGKLKNKRILFDNLNDII